MKRSEALLSLDNARDSDDFIALCMVIDVLRAVVKGEIEGGEDTV